jgi:hypothetical protein
LVRRAKAKWKDSRERERLHGKFLKTAERLGIATSAREETWQMVEKFIGFGFCKAHAATYADLAYRMATEGALPRGISRRDVQLRRGLSRLRCVEEAKRWGIEVRLPR